MLLLLALTACTDKTYTLDSGDTGDTGVPQCGRIRGTEGILMYQEGGSAIRTPLETPNATDVTSGVAGPVGDDRTYVAVVNGRAMQSLDGGCNWDGMGALPAGDWKLRAAGTRVYAFDTTSEAGATSDDGGLTWLPFDTVEPFIDTPVVDEADPLRIRGLQARGVVTSNDGGDTWSVGGALPAELTEAVAGDVAAGDLDVAVVGGVGGGWRTENAGTSWSQVIVDEDVTAIVIHPDDLSVLFAQTTNAEGTRTISRSSDAGSTWARQVDSSQIDLAEDGAIWPVPGNTLQAVSANGPVHNDNTDTDGLNLYVVTGGEGTRTVYVATWFHIGQLTFGGDRWVAAADAVLSP